MNQYFIQNIVNSTKAWIIRPVYSFLNKLIFSTIMARSSSFFVILNIYMCVCMNIYLYAVPF